MTPDDSSLIDSNVFGIVALNKVEYHLMNNGNTFLEERSLATIKMHTVLTENGSFRSRIKAFLPNQNTIPKQTD